MAGDASLWGTVNKPGITATQRAWLAYRDALAAFAAESGASPETVKARLTRARIKDLDAFLT